MILVFWRDGSTTVEPRGSKRIAGGDLKLAITTDEAYRQLTDGQNQLEQATEALLDFTESGYCTCDGTTGVTPDGTLVCLDVANCRYAKAYRVTVRDYAKALPGEDYEQALRDLDDAGRPT